MAIDNTGISSLDAGAHDITYSGNQGPKSPEQERQMAFDDTPGFELQPLELLLDEFREDNNGQDPHSIDHLRQFFYNKYGPKGIAKVEQAVQQAEQQAQMQEQREGIQMASAADPMLQEEYDKYVFEMQEMGQEPMSLEQFRQEAVAGMATGGRAGYANGQLVQPTRHGVRPGYRGDAAYASKSEQSKKEYGGQGQTAKERGDTGPRDYGDGPKSEVAPPPYTPPTEKEIEKIFKEPTLKEKIKEKKDQYSDWYTEKQTAHLVKMKKKALADRLNKYYKQVNPDWKEEGYDDWFTADMSVGELEEGLADLPYAADVENWTGKEQADWADYPGSAPGLLSLATDRLGAKHFSDEHANRILDEIRGIQESGDMNWLERMKKFSPNQYAIYTGQDRDPRSGTFTPRRDDQGTMQTTALPATDATGTALASLDDPNKIDEFDVARQGLIYAADGGRAGYAGGGLADLRQAYGLGKLVKKLTKGVKKVAKSPLGKIGLGLLAYHFGPQLLAKSGANIGTGSEGWKGLQWMNKGWDTATKTYLDPSNVSMLKAIGLPSVLGGAYTAMAPDEKEEPSWYDKWLADQKKYMADIGEFSVGREDPIYQRTPMSAADGGRIGYADGGNDEEEDHRSAALSAMYGLRKNAQEGGLMDMGGMEKDYRNEGGFVPIGGQERADDVPARLSKNEFVFTADAVRAAGGGDIDKGAEVMENVMENLEKGGNVSEESQGLEGARDMFATSQRLEGVL